MATLRLPADVNQVLRRFLVCEFSTLARDGTPVTYPVCTMFYPEGEDYQFVLCTSSGMPHKALNVRRCKKVSLLFSEPTGSELVDPPAVLVIGDAESPDRLYTGIYAEPEGVHLARTVFARQPAAEVFSRNPILKRLSDWYRWRIVITVKARRILWWEHADFSQSPQELDLRASDPEASDVE